MRVRTPIARSSFSYGYGARIMSRASRRLNGDLGFGGF
jgi:hypothetical protein